MLIAGTSSDAGKSLVVTGLCRALRNRGLDVAPFKAQNMSNNSMVCTDGAEIGRAQYLQAQAARIEPTSAMNPVLLKPGSDRRSFVVLRGRPYGTLEAGQYATGRTALAEAAFAAYAELAGTHELIVAEGAGSPAEINLRAGDYVNLGLARRFDLPMVVVGDIDRGGVFASLYGTVALLEPGDRAAIRGYLINKFRGDRGVLEPGLAMLTERTGLSCLGVLPWLPGVWLDAEDTLEVGAWRASPRSTTDHDRLRVAVVRFPRVSNITDVEALAAEPGVDVLVTTDPRVVSDADLVVLPGTRTTGRRSRLAAPNRAGRRDPAAGGEGATGAGHLRRLSDAGPHHRGRRRERRRAARRAGSAAGGCALRRDQDAGPADRATGVVTRCRRTRSTTAWPYGIPRTRARRRSSWTAGGPGRSGAPCGTARWRTTRSAGPG